MFWSLHSPTETKPPGNHSISLCLRGQRVSPTNVHNWLHLTTNYDSNQTKVYCTMHTALLPMLVPSQMRVQSQTTP